MSQFDQGLQLPAKVVRAWQRITGARGGKTPRGEGSVLAVIQVDDHSRAGYPGALHWHASCFAAAAPANYSVCAVSNSDPTPRRSVVAVDRIWWRIPDLAGDVLVGATTQGTIPNSAGTGGGAYLTDLGEPSAAGGPQFLPNVQAWAGNVALGQAPLRVPTNDLLPHELRDCQFSLGPQMFCVLHPGVVNSALYVYFEGRYYPEQ